MTSKQAQKHIQAEIDERERLIHLHTKDEDKYPLRTMQQKAVVEGLRIALNILKNDNPNNRVHPGFHPVKS